MTTSIKLDSNTKHRIKVGLMRPIKGARAFFTALAIMVDQDAMLTFRHEGARAGHVAWMPFSANTLQTKAGTWKIRYGTDRKPLDKSSLASLRANWVRTRGFGATGEMRKGIRRYGTKSKLLQAGGGFMRSFRIRNVTNKSMLYGTNHVLAEKIMSLGERRTASFQNRNVLFITPKDEQKYADKFEQFYLRGLHF